MKRSFRFVALVAFAVAGQASAQVVGYNNLVTFSGQGFANGGSANQAGNTITTMVADDVTLANPSLGTILSFQFTVANFNGVNVSARPRVRFYDNDGTGAGPGTFLTGFTFNPISFTAGNVATFNFVLPTPLVTDGTFWAGIVFDDNTGGTGATQAQMDLLGQGLFNPPSVGSSLDVFFQTSTAGSFAASNPGGSFFNFGGAPVANFGWSFVVQVPEPSAYAMIAVAAGGAMLLRRRTRKATSAV